MEEGKPENPEKKTVGARMSRANNKLNPHVAPRQGIEPGSHW